MKHITFITSLLIISTISYAQFNLNNPANNTYLKTEGLSSTPVSIGWGSQNTLTGTITYTWHLDALAGNFTSPIISVPSNNMGSDTNLTLDFGTVNSVLKGAGVLIGDTAMLKWTVTASNGMTTIVSPDTFNINLTRGASISAFDLVFPANGFAATVEGDDKTKLDITWNSSGEGATYAWFLDLASGNFSSPVVGPLASNNMGQDTVLTLDFATIDAVLAGAGLTNGQTANLKWKVHTYAGTDSIASTATYTIDLTKGTLLKDFDLVFPTNGFAATIEGKADTKLDIRWESSAMGSTYDWYLDLASGDFSSPLVGPLASNNSGMDTVITLDYATINSVLSGAGVAIGTTANLKWMVKSKVGSAEKSSSSEFTIDLTRGSVIESFMLSFPTDGFAATIENDSTKELTILWNNAGEGATYKWFLDLATGDYSNAVVPGLASNNMGSDTALTLKFSTIYSVLSGAGVAPGATANLKWKVHAYAGTDSIASGDFKIDLTRAAGSTSIFNISNSNDTKVGPNPVTRGEILFVSATSKIQSVQIIDVTGKKVELPNLELGSTELQIESSDLNTGLFFINILTDNGMQTKKLIVQ